MQEIWASDRDGEEREGRTAVALSLFPVFCEVVENPSLAQVLGDHSLPSVTFRSTEEDQKNRDVGALRASLSLSLSACLNASLESETARDSVKRAGEHFMALSPACNEMGVCSTRVSLSSLAFSLERPTSLHSFNDVNINNNSSNKGNNNKQQAASRSLEMRNNPHTNNSNKGESNTHVGGDTCSLSLSLSLPTLPPHSLLCEVSLSSQQ